MRDTQLLHKAPAMIWYGELHVYSLMEFGGENVFTCTMTLTRSSGSKNTMHQGLLSLVDYLVMATILKKRYYIYKQYIPSPSVGALGTCLSCDSQAF